ncbi:MAG: MarR family winged helix-turn-helix transcriptional regulator [Candidatus Puniceispirillaceae bacterium]|jgi:DNA-binding MarR family transcriptional regulator|nr:MarR family transcriptional regulator [Alphaproteobacteria bacterium]
MTVGDSRGVSAKSLADDYQLDDQVGYKLRLASQRHLEIFSRQLPDITPTQFSVLVRLREVGEVSQNQLGRLVAMDAATTKGVIARLMDRGLLRARQDTDDMRRLQISLTDVGQAAVEAAIITAKDITKETTERLTSREVARLLTLLDKLQQ